MSNYIRLIRRQEFIDLLKFGEVLVCDCFVRATKNIKNDLANDKKIDSLFSTISVFDNPLDYLIIICNKGIKRDNLPHARLLKIVDLSCVIPLNNYAYHEYQSTFDQRIHFTKPEKDFYVQIQFLQECTNRIKGVENLVYSLGLDYSLNDYQTDSRNKNLKLIISAMQNEKVLEDGNQESEYPLIAYVLNYGRNESFEKTNKGYFYHALMIFCQFTNKKICTKEDVIGTDFYKTLKNISEKNLKLGKIYERVQNTNVSKLYDKNSGFKDFLLTVTVFLSLTDNRQNVDQDFLDNKLKMAYNKAGGAETISKQSFYDLLYLLGIYYGYEHTCDVSYDKKQLKIFKNR